LRYVEEEIIKNNAIREVYLINLLLLGNSLARELSILPIIVIH